MDYKKLIAQSLVIEGANTDEIIANITQPLELKNGEYSFPCFKFSKALRLSPVAIANNLRDSFYSGNSLKQQFNFLSGVEAVNGYLNFKLNRNILAKNTIENIFNRGESFCSFPSNGKTIVLDYSSINIAKPFHIGHLLTTAIGGSLYRIFNYLGYKAVGINHLGDWGTQFGKLIVAYKKWGNDADIKKRNIHALLDLYVKFHEEAEKDDNLNNEGRYWFKQIEDGNAEALKIFDYFKQVTLTEVSKVYDRLGISFDSYNGESFFNDKLEAVVAELKDKNLVATSDGALVVDLEKYDMPPCLILKKDGASLYATRDLAAAIYRKKQYNFDKCLYVVAYQQNLHFKQFFKVLELMGHQYASDMIHVPFGMVSLEGGASLSTRKGNVVFLSDVLENAVAKAGEIIQQKNPELAGKADIAECVGVGAIIFSALSTARIKDMVFSYEKALNFDGETAPYLQYTHARCASLLSKKQGMINNADFSVLTDDESFEVVKMLARYDDVVLAAAERYEPSIIARYLIDLAQSFNKFYIAHRIVGEVENVSNARALLAACVKNALANGLNLILIKAPNKM